MRLFAGLRRIVLLGLSCLLITVPAIAEPERVQPNVPGLFKRIVAKPGAELRKDPKGAVIAKPKAFSTYYVFGNKAEAGKKWLNVGPTAAGQQIGWILEEQSVPLQHLLVLCPAARQNRERAIFFKDQAALSKMAKDANRVTTYKDSVRQAGTDTVPASVGAVAIEPPNVANCIDAFTFMPIVSVADNNFVPNLGNLRYFKTLSVPLPVKASKEPDFKTGVVFVIDTSISMGPYIESVRKSVARVSSEIRDKPSGKNVSFGLIAYRDSKKAASTQEYVTEVVHPLEETFRPAVFDAKNKVLQESKASNSDFREDAVAGLAEALNLPGWDKFQARTIILVTDAGMREHDDPKSQTGLGLDHIAAEARTKGIAIVSLFLKTEAGKAEHADAARQHRAVGKADGDLDRLVEINGGSLAEFAANVDKALAASARNASENSAQAAQRLAQTCATTARLSDIDRVLCDLDATTQAMRVEWLGRKAGASPPTVVEGWVSDLALDSPGSVQKSVAFRPFLLLTRNQMNDLRLAFKPLVAINGADIDSNTQKVIEVFQTAIARGAVDTSTLAGSGCRPGANTCRIDDATSLKALLPAWIGQVPLTSRFMKLKVSDWVAPTTRRGDIDRVRAIIVALDRWIDSPRGWVKLAPDASRDEDVYAVPWELIP